MSGVTFSAEKPLEVQTRKEIFTQPGPGGYMAKRNSHNNPKRLVFSSKQAAGEAVMASEQGKTSQASVEGQAEEKQEEHMLVDMLHLMQQKLNK